ncbi:PglL family O-oligosaccharyltransferase [Diaphorobacter nitroreducens]|uniref:PglL family O-oligosaccharyltransferase n=1 Tax=Diaphorobacter nitroreducens TaxID=164759 RepID=UPI00289FB2AE|nr:Wzy polymerase domain-containing protein [Diaphorobacter nitroreducens]
MRPDFAPLAVLAMALPFVFGITEAPYSNFWPLLASGACAWLLAALAWCGAWRPSAARLGAHLAAGLLLAALVAAAIGLVQFFMGDPGWAPWVHASSPGLAFGNLRQRNQQATLLALGVWALLWWVARLQEQVDGNPVLAGRGARWPVLAAVAVPWAMVLLATAGAATASRTGALEWLVVLALLAVWRRSSGALALGMAGVGLAVYAVAAWGLPQLLLRWTGMRMDGLFMRMADGSQTCVGRATLWSNVLELIAQRPWAGWGWGELDYAHYIHPFAGERFCVLLDNAHNLPLHLAVELGLPAALLLCGVPLWAALRARPWREAQPHRQLAWGVLALVGVHSLLEFPLWYGPFQLATALAVLVLLAPWLSRAARWRPVGAVVVGAALLAAPAMGFVLVRDYARVSALYRPTAERPAALRALTAADAARQVWFFRAPAQFAQLTTAVVTPANAAEMHALALQLLHYSPEPRVIEKLIASARLLGREDEVALHTDRYRRAYPYDFGRWQRGQPSGGPPLER